ncbi:MAG: ABC transporter permease [Clostridia bacterium]|nr:ABC transporter permease [Clostridia bacterium]
MYIFKNAFKCIGRSLGRNVLIGIIALIIAVSACIGLSIRQAAENAKTDTLENMSVTATISYDRQSAMNNIMEDFDPSKQEGGFDREQFSEIMDNAQSLTLEDYKKYASAESVKDFYYTLTAYLNGTDTFEAVTTETEEENDNTSSSDNFPGMPGGMGGFSGGFGGGKNPMGGGKMSTGDFTVIGYSSDTAMTNFQNGTTSVTSGVVFDEATEDLNCIISEELATFNNISVEDVISISNPQNEEEVYELTVVGIYKSSESNDLSGSMFGIGQDPANKIYLSASALQKIIDASAEADEANTDSDEETAIKGTLAATYAFADVDSYNAFENEVRELGLDEAYTISSSDLSQFENSLRPLNTLSSTAGWFLIVILIIGAAILIVLNIFNVRERKYEIGVLTAMGMKKGKVALQFLVETLIVTMIAIIIGACVGAVSSVPVTNTLLENQIASQQQNENNIENNFGRPGGPGGDMPSMPGGFSGNFSDIKNFDDVFDSTANYISEIDSAMNLTVVAQMLGIGLLLTVIASAASISFIMRYDPLKILANRD